MPAEAGERFISLSGCRVRYLTAGSGPALLLAHGLCGYSFCFRHNLPALALQHQVFALDFPGCGFSGPPPAGDTGLLPTARMLIDFVRQLGLKSPAMLGSSHGGAVVAVAARRALEEGIPLGSLVLVAPVNPWSRWGARRAARLGHPLGAAVFRALAPFLLRNYAYFHRRMYGNPTLVTRDLVQGYTAGLRQPGTVRHLLGRVRHWQADLALMADALPVCARHPVLLIWGDRDRAVNPASARNLLRSMPQARLAVIAGAGHLPFEERPEEFNRLVLDFLAAQRASD